MDDPDARVKADRGRRARAAGTAVGHREPAERLLAGQGAWLAGWLRRLVGWSVTVRQHMSAQKGGTACGEGAPFWMTAAPCLRRFIMTTRRSAERRLSLRRGSFAPWLAARRRQ